MLHVNTITSNILTVLSNTCKSTKNTAGAFITVVYAQNKNEHSGHLHSWWRDVCSANRSVAVLSFLIKNKWLKREIKCRTGGYEMFHWLNVGGDRVGLKACSLTAQFQVEWDL